jgi:ATP-dependent helicase Lhr and Lhr-like helicase
MKSRDSVLRQFHPLIQKWFEERLGRPTEIQSKSWPEIAAGKHALVTAPTGSGKTLTAFLWTINQLITGAWPSGQTRVLYVSPLKALNNDIQRNLTSPLNGIASYFEEAGQEYQAIRVLTRSGDTPPDERRRMLKHPPEILITTPESLNILLTSRSGRAFLTGLSTVILDEIHSVVGTKRGTHLITAVDRLVRLSGEFQRIALSATVAPLDKVAAFVGGFIHEDGGDSDNVKSRVVKVIRSRQERKYSIDVVFPEDAREHMVDSSWWPVLIDAFKKIIKAHKSTLLFVNSRRTAEKVARLINEDEAEALAYAHHGSLSKEIRLAVEQKLKDGELRAIVATSSLELGIDIGDLEQVVLIETPPAISSAIQRIGRSGHSVSGTSQGLLFPTHGTDFLTAAVIARSVTEQDIESATPVDGPLDVLAQIILSMVSVERWDIDELFAFMRTTYPYRHLRRRQFDLVISMLAGRYAETRVRELRPRVSLDKIDNTIHGKEGVQRLVYGSGGTIPDRGYFDLRVEGSRAKIGELDEEFVWERRIGDTFAFGAHVWRTERITPNDVEVTPTEAKPGIIPFWKAEEMGRDFHFSQKILQFLEGVNDQMKNPSLADELSRVYHLDKGASAELVGYLSRQQEQTAVDLPHRHHILIEHFQDPQNTSDTKQVIIHTLWGAKVIRPFGLALQAAWEEKHHYHLEVIDNNDCLLLILPHEFSVEDVFSLVTPENLERLLRLTLEKSGFFGARFRENAGHALLLPRMSFKKRLPLWLNRLRSKKLMDAVLSFPDFPILLETWRTCLQGEFDLDNLRILLDEVRTGRIRVTEIVMTTASPFAESLVWKQTNQYMYEDDSPRSGKTSALTTELLKEVLSSASLRPRIPLDLVRTMEDKLQRTTPGYSPRSPVDLLDWVKERLLIREQEWLQLLKAMERDHGVTGEEMVTPVARKLAMLRLPGADETVIYAAENVDRIYRAFSVPSAPTVPAQAGATEAQKIGRLGATIPQSQVFSDTDKSVAAGEELLPGLLSQWLSFYGPLQRDFIQNVLGIKGALLDRHLGDLEETQAIIVDLLTESTATPEICDRENLETLLRMARKARQPSFRALPIDHLPLFLAAWQGVAAKGDSTDDLQDRLDQLFGFPAPADAWEKHILPARLAPYYGSWLDSLVQAAGLNWFGCGKERVSFSFVDDLDLFLTATESDVGEASGRSQPADKLHRLFPQAVGRYTVAEISRFSSADRWTIVKQLWEWAWNGLVSNDTFAAVRQGSLSHFTSPGQGEDRRTTLRRGRNRWGTLQLFPGNWFILDRERVALDPVDESELIKDRVRQLFKRYGVLFREIVANELPLLQWSAVFRALRLMELSGEILSGYFFEGVPGLQFISHEAYRFLNEPLPHDSVYWIAAIDPASLCGIKLDALKGGLPSRLPSTHLVYRGKELVVLSRKNGSSLTFTVPPDDPRLPDYLALFRVFLGREQNPEKMVTVETINGKSALESSYAPPLREVGFIRGYKGLELVRRYV